MTYLCLPEDLAEANQLINRLSKLNKEKAEIESRLSEITRPKHEDRETLHAVEEAKITN